MVCALPNCTTPPAARATEGDAPRRSLSIACRRSGAAAAALHAHHSAPSSAHLFGRARAVKLRDRGLEQRHVGGLAKVQQPARRRLWRRGWRGGHRACCEEREAARALCVASDLRRPQQAGSRGQTSAGFSAERRRPDGGDRRARGVVVCVVCVLAVDGRWGVLLRSCACRARRSFAARPLPVTVSRTHERRLAEARARVSCAEKAHGACVGRARRPRFASKRSARAHTPIAPLVHVF